MPETAEAIMERMVPGRAKKDYRDKFGRLTLRGERGAFHPEDCDEFMESERPVAVEIKPMTVMQDKQITPKRPVRRQQQQKRRTSKRRRN